MLQQLYIKNFTLIDELKIQFYPGFSVITGETGAGKSIILGAIGLLLGNRADLKTIKSGQDKCIIEAYFDLSKYDLQEFFTQNEIDYYPNETIVRRELTASGKSRAFINDTPVALGKMRELGEQLVDIHSQHQNLLLQKEDFQLNVIDIIAQDTKEKTAYQGVYKEYRKAERELEELKDAISRNRENEDFLRFQYKELDEANLQEGEQEELEQEAQTLSHAEEIKSALFEADSLLSANNTCVIDQLRSTQQLVEKIKDVYPSVSDVAERLESSYIELKDIASEISSKVDDVDFDPARLETINTRLDKLYALQQKYHVSDVEELIQRRENIKEELNGITGCDEHLQEMEQKTTLLKEKACQTATRLTAIRKKAARKVEATMKEKLIPLGIPNVQFEVVLEDKPLSSDGADKVSFLFSANKSTLPQPITQVASGGEIARVMLSLKAMISGAVKLPTIIFDEIDTGVSGKIAEKMAQIMAEMGQQDRQVISITHLPQIAALGAHHYKVVKEETEAGTISRMTELNTASREQEIAQMLSGSDVSEAALANAKALLGTAKISK